MSEIHIIEFSRNKEEYHNIYFGKEYKKAMIMQIVRIILILPGCIVFAFLATILFQVVLKFDEVNYIISYSITALLAIIVLMPFIKPMIIEHKSRKMIFSQIFENYEIINTICTIDNSAFVFKNELFEYSTNWKNIRNVKLNGDNFLIETISPNVKFSIPRKNMNKNIFEYFSEKVKSS